MSNTFKSVVWIAVDVPVARAARPYVESLAKKATAAVVALDPRVFDPSRV